MGNEFNSIVEKIAQTVQETEDDFIFETVRPFCEDVIQSKISKQDLARAVVNYHGSRITIYDGAYKADEAMKGPLGRRALEPMRYPYNFDPTDPAI